MMYAYLIFPRRIASVCGWLTIGVPRVIDSKSVERWIYEYQRYKSTKDQTFQSFQTPGTEYLCLEMICTVTGLFILI